MSKYFDKQRKAKPPSEKDRENGRRSHALGQSAEEQVAKLFPYWTRLEGKPGHDFVVEIPNGKNTVHHFIEVKSTFSEEPIPTPEQRRKGKPLREPSILFKVMNGQWMNQVADELVILTRTHIYFGKADEVRQFIAAFHDDFRAIRDRHHYVRISVPISRMLEHNIIGGVERKKIKAIATRVRMVPKKVEKAVRSVPKPLKPLTAAERARLFTSPVPKKSTRPKQTFFARKNPRRG